MMVKTRFELGLQLNNRKIFRQAQNDSIALGFSKNENASGIFIFILEQLAFFEV